MWAMYEKPTSEAAAQDEQTLTFPVYAAVEPWGFSGLDLPIEQVNINQDAIEAALTLIEDAADNLGCAGNGQIVAQVAVGRNRGVVLGYELEEKFR